jgi:hypothetical protein
MLDQIVVSHPDGAGQMVVVSRPRAGHGSQPPPGLFGNLSSPSWSPDGTRIAFADDGAQGIFSVNLDGSGLTQLTSNPVDGDYSPTWSPDGAKIAFIRYSFSNDVYSLVVANADGTNPTTIHADYDAAPDWQPIPPGYVRPKAAGPTRLSLVPAAKPCTASNRTHGPPLAFPSCSPVTSQSPNLTIGVGDGNPAGAKSSGFVRLDPIVGAPGGPDDSDVDLRFTLTNVMKLSDLSDYTGELRAALGIRLTDKMSLPVSSPATVSDLTFSFTVPCTATPDTTIGATCGLATRADALLPGSVPEGLRSVWALDQAKVYDGGPDGDADTPGDNSLFMTQGLFIP